MPKGYWIGRVDVHNDEGYKPYALANNTIFKKFGGRFVVRAGKFENPEGSARSRNATRHRSTTCAQRLPRAAWWHSARLLAATSGR